MRIWFEVFVFIFDIILQILRKKKNILILLTNSFGKSEIYRFFFYFNFTFSHSILILSEKKTIINLKCSVNVNQSMFCLHFGLIKINY